MNHMNMPVENAVAKSLDSEAVVFRTWICLLCGWVYDEQQGDVLSGLAAGTLWKDVPDDWICPDCGVGKDEFELMEI
jgi:rubredoxin